MNNIIMEHAAKILIVEDNPVDIDLTQRAFKKLNIDCTIEIAKDGEEVYQASQRWEAGLTALPTIILLDLKMPRMDGFDVLNLIKQSPKSRMIPIIMLTSSNEEKDILSAYQQGANSYLLKPIDYGEFLSLIQMISDYWLTKNCFPKN